MTEPTVSNGSIEELRKVIDATDAELFGLLEKRAKLARSIGKLKAAGAVYKPSASARFLSVPWREPRPRAR